MSSIYTETVKSSKIISIGSKTKPEEWLVFGISDQDYPHWAEKAKRGNAKLTIFSIDSLRKTKPENIILGNFNDIVELSNLEDSFYDRIMFGNSVVKFLEWYGIHVSILSHKLKPEGILYLPQETSSTIPDPEKFSSVFKRTEKNREEGMTSKIAYLRLFGLPSAVARRAKQGDFDNPYEKPPFYYVYIGDRRPVLTIESKFKSKIDREQLKYESEEFYDRKNREVFEHYFEKVEFFTLEQLKKSGDKIGYETEDDLWILSFPKRHDYTEIETKIISHNINLKDDEVVEE